MANDLIAFNVIESGIKKLRAKAENGVKRITADFLVINFFEDIESMKKRGYRYDEIMDELHIMLAEAVPDKSERDKLFSLKPGTLKVYMSRKRKEMAELASKTATEKQERKKLLKNSKSAIKHNGSATAIKTNPTQPIPATSQTSGYVPTGRAKATNLDRDI